MTNGLMSNAQFGFLPGRSTISNLLITDHSINKELSTGNAVDVFFDVSKAFDIIILFHILLHCTKFLIHLGWLGNYMLG